MTSEAAPQTSVVACVVCARPLDSLLTGGLQAGVLVLAVVALAVIGAFARGAVRLLREDAAVERDAAGPDVRAAIRAARGQP